MPDVRSPRRERLVAARDAARRTLGIGLVIGAPVVVVVSWRGDEVACALVIPAVWLAASTIALLAYALTLSAARVDVTPRPSSRALLFAGLALLGPLTLHLVVQAHEWAPSAWLAFVGDEQRRTFAGWLDSSLILAGPSHVVFALLCAIRGYRGDGKPHFLVIGALTSAAALYCCALWGRFGLLPTAYVAVTCVPLLLLMRRLERVSA